MIRRLPHGKPFVSLTNHKYCYSASSSFSIINQQYLKLFFPLLQENKKTTHISFRVEQKKGLEKKLTEYCLFGNLSINV